MANHLDIGGGLETVAGQRVSRRGLLGAGMAQLAVSGTRGIGMGLGVPLALGHVAQALAQDAASKQRILVVVELSGGNDGLNTLVPYADDA